MSLSWPVLPVMINEATESQSQCCVGGLGRAGPGLISSSICHDGFIVCPEKDVYLCSGAINVQCALRYESPEEHYLGLLDTPTAI